MKVVAALVLLPLMGGCMFFGSCGPSTSATWVEPGLYGGLDAVAREHDGDLRPTSVPEGLPFSDAALDAAWPGVELWVIQQVQTSDVAGFPREVGASVQDGPSNPYVYLNAAANTTELELRQMFTPFIENATRSSRATQETWFRGLLANKEPAAFEVTGNGSERPVAYVYSLRLSADWRLDELFRDLGGFEAIDTDDSTASRGFVSLDDWSFRFLVPEIELVVALENDEVLRLHASPTGSVQVMVPEEYATDEAKAKLWIARAFRSIDLESPSFRNYEQYTYIC